MAWLGIIFFIYMDTQDHAIYHIWIRFIFPSSYAQGEKPFGLELELNPGPLASQATTLTTRLCLLGHFLLMLKVEFKAPTATDCKRPVA